MGYSVPCAIGAKLADKEKTVVAVCGDGSFQMQMMELGTMCQHDVDIKIIVMTNGKLGLVREIQKTSYKNNQIAVDLKGSPDVISIAKAYGIKGQSVSTMEDAEKAIHDMLRHNGPYVMECIVDELESSV